MTEPLTDEELSVWFTRNRVTSPRLCATIDALTAERDRYRAVADGLYEFLIRTDSVTSWVRHRVHRDILGEESVRELEAVSIEARRRTAALAALTEPEEL
jgi:hypothetical protein